MDDDLSTRRTEDRLRTGLRARAALVEAPDRLEDVLAAAGAARGRRWVPLVAAAAVAAVVGGSWAVHEALGSDPRPTSVAGTPTPSPSTPPTTPAPPTTSPSPTATPSTPAAAAPLPVYVIVPEVADAPDGRFGLRREWHATTVVDEVARVREAVQAALDAPLLDVTRGPWADVEVTAVEVRADGVVVTLSRPPRTVGSAADDLALPSLGWTAQAVLGRGNLPVTVRADGATLGVVTRPATDEWWTVLTDVWVTEPVSGAVLPGGRPVQVRGEASVFEGALSWELERGGSPVRSGHVTASAGGPARGTYTVDLGTLDPGTYTVRVTALSPKDGSVSASDAATFVVK